jgi:hypothetical protein
MARFAYEIREFGTDKLLGGGCSKEGAFETAAQFMESEYRALENSIPPMRAGLTFTLREIPVAQYMAELHPPHEHE